MSRYHFWIYDKDEDGRPLDEAIIKTAEQIHPILIQYRQKEIDCDSTVNTILQSAVEAASKASRTNRIRNPRAYLVSVYHRLVDNLLDQRQHYMPTQDAVLEVLANRAHRISWEDTVNNRLMLGKLIDEMDDYTRQICQWVLSDYSMNEIAKELCITPKLASKRWRAGLRRITKKQRS